MGGSARHLWSALRCRLPLEQVPSPHRLQLLEAPAQLHRLGRPAPECPRPGAGQLPAGAHLPGPHFGRLQPQPHPRGPTSTASGADKGKRTYRRPLPAVSALRPAPHRTREEARNYVDFSASFFASDRVSGPSVPASSSARTSRLSSAGPTARMMSRTVL